MEKKGELLNQLAIISDLLEKINIDTISRTVILELNKEEFLKSFELIQKNTVEKWTNQTVHFQYQ